MGRWGLWSAHRYLEADTGNTRWFGRDGRPLTRPWRAVDADVMDRVRVQRRARPQPRWPRLLGGLCLASAFVAAFDALHPIPRHVAGSASTETGGAPLPLSAVAPSGAIGAEGWRFEWRGAKPEDPATIVVCDASYAEMLRVTDLRGSSFAADATLRQRLTELGTFHWFVETSVGERVHRSRFTTCEIRR